MSGIYIKGMEMPTEGFITVTITSDGRVAGNSQKINGKFEYLDNKDIASAIPVPDHGRLIDANKLFKEMEREYWFDNADWDKAEDLVISAPTVIPAEEGQ